MSHHHVIVTTEQLEMLIGATGDRLHKARCEQANTLNAAVPWEDLMQECHRSEMVERLTKEHRITLPRSSDSLSRRAATERLREIGQLLARIVRVNGLAQGGEQSPNAMECVEASRDAFSIVETIEHEERRKP